MRSDAAPRRYISSEEMSRSNLSSPLGPIGNLTWSPPRSSLTETVRSEGPHRELRATHRDLFLPLREAFIQQQNPKPHKAARRIRPQISPFGPDSLTACLIGGNPRSTSQQYHIPSRGRTCYRDRYRQLSLAAPKREWSGGVQSIRRDAVLFRLPSHPFCNRLMSFCCN